MIGVLLLFGGIMKARFYGVIMEKFIASHREQFDEIVRFIIVGVIATIADYGTSLIFKYLIYKDPGQWVILGIAFTRNLTVATLAGFVVGVIVNYIMSIFFVFKNVANKKTSRSIGGFIAFVILGFIGLLINVGIKQIGDNIYTTENFWWFSFVFAIATLIVLVYNYITRKLILFRPNKQQSNQANGESKDGK
jgi:putative flippase GtrA